MVLDDEDIVAATNAASSFDRNLILLVPPDGLEPPTP